MTDKMDVPDEYLWAKQAFEQDDLQQRVTRRVLLNNGQGDKMAMLIEGDERAVGAYVEKLQVAFRVHPDEVIDFGVNDTLEDSDQPTPIANIAGALQIAISFPEQEAPYSWEVWLDPVFDVWINRDTSPHQYTTTPSEDVRASIHADIGNLTMTMAGASVTVQELGVRNASIRARSTSTKKRDIQVDGNAAGNRYDLTIQGAVLA